jgi:hypothetical protein
MATKTPVVLDGSYHRALADGDTLAYAPQIPAYTGEVYSIPYTQADLSISKNFLMDVPRGPVAHAHGFLGSLLLTACENVPLNWKRTIYFDPSGRVGKINSFGIVGIPLALNGSNSEGIEPFMLPVYVSFAAGAGNARISVGYQVRGYNTVADGASFHYQLLGNYLM